MRDGNRPKEDGKKSILKTSRNHRLYLLYDYLLNARKGLSLENFVMRAKAMSASYIQYRDKVNSDQDKLRNIEKLRALWDGTLIINDDLSLVVYGDGLHVGQEDLEKIDTCHEKAIKEIRAAIGRKILGVSTHNKAEILVANRLDIDYIGLGAYRQTSTKDVTSVLGDEISTLAAFSRKPVAAIGGVRKDDCLENIDFLVIGSDFYED